MMRALMLGVLFVLHGAAAAHGAEPCPRAAGGAEWSAQCFTGQGGERRVKPKYLGRLAWNEHGMATVLIAEPRELLAVDRTGRVVVPNIRHTGDFDFPQAAHGIGRFDVRQAGTTKCGYFVAGRFTVLVPPQYDQCQAFRDDKAVACEDCVRYCTDQECHDSVLVGGTGIAFDTAGKVKRRYPLPTLEQACPNGKASVENGGPVPVLRCAANADSPFKL
ncbi:hypothetical protein IP92_02614 [Pseudoduganella flava]|uniref:WG repeat-containing protein n=1 Tax=Pseudoduganella flava TaxID=871742 RepID=A0A562PSY6_9BURK|nr:hypothetical protein [Pseudoduganella flava]QGZ39159.1 hypothetical protein GO485_08945 [Pseudoduganella flava]TWI47554.1 hypothetical protein IP92_02614 [Pseudoduganella flava]